MFQAKCVLITWTFMALYLFIKWIFGGYLLWKYMTVRT